MGETQIAAVKDAVHKLQLALLDGIGKEDGLIVAGSLMSRGDYEDVVTERSIVNLCGYPLCGNKLPFERSRRGRYRVSLKEHKVFDLQESDMYCSSSCVVNSHTFAASLKEERSSDLNPAKIEHVMKKFAGMSLEAKSEGLGENGDLGMSMLKIQEKTENNTGNMSLGDWAGPSNAIEGYVPRKDRSSQPSHSGKQKKVSKAKQKEKQTSFFSDMDFTSCIITGDEYCVSKMPSSSMDAAPSAPVISMATPSSSDTDHQFYKSNMETNTKGSKGGSKQNLIKGKEVATENGASLVVGPTGTTGVACVDDVSMLCEGLRKSSLKSSGSRKQTHSVSWADEQVGDYGLGNLCEFEELGDMESGKMYTKGKTVIDGNNGDDIMFRFASAEACATALNLAAEAVASGDADVMDAVSEAGIIILPSQHDEDQGEVAKDYAMADLDTTAIKWPKKREISESDILDSTDSWLDPPPDGFSLTLSPFATMFMSIFTWITSSSVAYIYGQDESSHEEYLSINGKEYPQKVTLSDGRSSEIKLGLAGCLARALPGLVAELRLPVPVSIMEKHLGRLLETMTFIDPLPSLRMKQWQLITLLFLDALSVCRIPALQPIMTSQRMLLHKVFESAHIGIEEYEVMKDHIIPLGRTPQFSAQCGA
uniref:RNA polymerase II subunit B1 CTD phosphatase RPAP2 homolog n=1 Tax=Kalanchoe fedtschenkoi TaxID=63787 RepID=A0A7N0TQG4_KALFE